MEYSSLPVLLSSMKTKQVNEVRKHILKPSSSHLLQVADIVPPILSAYDVAWLAMIPAITTSPRQQHHQQPMFKSCLEWILSNQNHGGFWGDNDHDHDPEEEEVLPGIHVLPATLACMVALKIWNIGQLNIQKGLAFLTVKGECILKQEQLALLPNWFCLVFPATIQLSQAVGLDVGFPHDLLSDIFFKRQQIFQRLENLAEKGVFPTSILAYADCLPYSLAKEEAIIENLSKDGSLFHSPSATSLAYLSNGNLQCLNYLTNLVLSPSPSPGVRYPMEDEVLVKLSMVDHIQRLGLGGHFCKDIDQILKSLYRYYQSNPEVQLPSQTQDLPSKLYKDSLAFRLLRMHGYNVKPCSFTWFMCNEELLDYMEENHQHLMNVLYSVYRATDVMFKGEYELERARSYAKKFLHISITADHDDMFMIPSGFQKMVEHELSHPWITRLDHLDHRMWIQQNLTSPLWMGGKEHLYMSEKLMRLASNNFESRQSIYAQEMKELTRWLEESGLKSIGFGREKSAYCYFASAASTCFSHDSISRLVMAKSAILITVADDFYDMEGSMSDLQSLTEAIQRWDGMKLRGHGKAIFTAVDDFLRDTVAKCLHQQTDKLLTMFKDIWKEAFGVWMVERSWSESGYIPSREEYLKTGMISIAVHTIVLMTYPCINPNFPIEDLMASQYHNITKSLMLVARLLNDTQSYQKEVKEGKINYVLLHNQDEGELDDSVEYVKNMLGEKTKEFLEYVLLMDDEDDMPRSLRELQLSCIKVFHMFFNSTNDYDYDSEDGVVNDMINKAFYIPLQSQKLEDNKVVPRSNRDAHQT